MQFETISSCPVICCLGDETDPQLSTALSKDTREAHLQQLSKFTWSLEVTPRTSQFEIQDLTFPFSACNPKHRVLNARSELPSSPGMPDNKSAGEPGLAAGVPWRGAQKLPHLSASPSAPTKCLVGYWDQHVQAQALRESEFSHILSFFSFFSIYDIERLCPSGTWGMQSHAWYLLFS